MADNTIKPIMSFCATVSDKVKDLVIKDSQLIFIYDEGKIALDYNGKRTFYNQIIELETETERQNLSEPINGKYYFVIEKAVLWRYYNGWKQITTSPEDFIFIGTELPELGHPQTLYVNKETGEISVWDETQAKYLKVSNYTDTISVEYISTLFNN